MSDDRQLLEQILKQTEMQTKALDAHIKYDFEKDRDMLNAIQESTQCMQKLDKKMELHIQKMEYELNNIHHLDNMQNEMLQEHMKRTELAEKRLEMLEEPGKVMKLLSKYGSKIAKFVIGLAAFIGAVYALMEYFNA